jgi:hypothetical protein
MSRSPTTRALTGKVRRRIVIHGTRCRSWSTATSSFSSTGPGKAANPATVQLLPRGVPHSVRIPSGAARIIQVSIGAPYDGFAKDMARLFAAGAPLDEIVAAANKHGVELG